MTIVSGRLVGHGRVETRSIRYTLTLPVCGMCMVGVGANVTNRMAEANERVASARAEECKASKTLHSYKFKKDKLFSKPS